jgi:hypothetical protein
MSLPRKLKNFNLFNDGNSFLGVASEVTLPKIAAAMEDWRGGGMLGAVKVDMGLQALEAEFAVGGMVKQLVRQMGDPSASGVLLRFAGAYQSDDGSGVQAVEAVMRGRIEELDMGNAKAGDDTEHKVKFPCSYYKLTIDGRVELEIDMLNAVYIVDGVDRYAEIRAALGV